MFERKTFSFRLISSLLIILFTNLTLFPCARAANLSLPAPNQFIGLSTGYSFPVLKGLKFNPQDPFNIKFIVDVADNKEVDKTEAKRLISYFLAGLTTPKENLWVNLSPYEKNRIIPEKLGETDLGKDLLTQDYILKQLMSSLTYPESKTGKDYWDKTYKEIQKIASTTKVPVNTFNKVWITPKDSLVYENKNTVLVLEAKLQAMLEEDYELQNTGNPPQQAGSLSGTPQKEEINKTASKIMKETILPKINKDVNSGKNFSTLRQIYYSLILATWFKKKFKESFFKHYIDKGKITGIDIKDKAVKEKIYNQYIQAYTKGIYDYIKKDYDLASNKNISKRYFSGGNNFSYIDETSRVTKDKKIVSSSVKVDNLRIVDSQLVQIEDNQSNAASSSPIAPVIANNPKSGVLVIDQEVAGRENLTGWINEEWELKTAGARGSVNPEDINDPAMFMNETKLAIYADVRAEMFKEKFKGKGTIQVNGGGDVRPHESKFISEIARIYAAQGIVVHVKKDYAPATIWEMCFGTFYYERDGADTVTASHADYERTGLKPATRRGSQLLKEEVADLTVRMKKRVESVGSTHSVEIPYAAVDDENIVFDFDIIKDYSRYFEENLGPTTFGLLKQGKEMGVEIPLICAGGAAQVTNEPVLETLDLAGIIDFRFGKPDIKFHGFGKDAGPDPTKSIYYTDPRVLEIVKNEKKSALTDPDNDRYVYLELINEKQVQAAKAAGVEIIEKDGMTIAKFSPCQLATLFVIFHLENMLQDGKLNKETSYIISTTYPSTYMVDEVVKAFGEEHGIDIHVVRNQVGFKYVDDVQQVVIGQMVQEKDKLVIEQVDGTRIELKNKKAVVIMGFEESGGINISSGEFESINGQRIMHILPEKDALQPLMFTAAIHSQAAIQGNTEAPVLGRYLEMIKHYKPKLIHYTRIDSPLYDKTLPKEDIPAAKRKAKDNLLKKLDFFKSMIELFEKEGSQAVIDQLKKNGFKGELPEIKKALWAADGPFFLFADGTWWDERGSGTDPLTRDYGDGTKKMGIKGLEQRLKAFSKTGPASSSSLNNKTRNVSRDGGINLESVDTNISPASSPVKMPLFDPVNLKGFTFQIIKIRNMESLDIVLAGAR